MGENLSKSILLAVCCFIVSFLFCVTLFINTDKSVFIGSTKNSRYVKFFMDTAGKFSTCSMSMILMAETVDVQVVAR